MRKCALALAIKGLSRGKAKCPPQQTVILIVGGESVPNSTLNAPCSVVSEIGVCAAVDAVP